MSDVTAELAMEANNKAMEITRLKSENDRLRNDADLLRAMLSQVQTEKRCYMSENAKLRELCADLRFCKRNNCLTCSHGRFCDMRFDERFAELGVEGTE